ncbi:MAG: CCA tRNA nucleotidyltransferase [Dehalococcoidales bacterium]|nr:CCA tRNA nucleotidyltransferase [Dehalococcoidales bacterium]
MENLRLVVKPEASRLLAKISRFLSKEGIGAYLVGGFVRDMLLVRDTADIDIAVAADAPATAGKVANVLDGKCIPLDEENGVARIVLPESKWQIDFTTLQGDIENDLANRDFTIDAMAIGLEADFTAAIDPAGLIDPFNGREDLDRGMVKAVSDTVFEADAARLIRAVRIAAELGFHIDSHTAQLIKRDCKLITNVAGERVREELLRLLAIPGAGQRLAHLDELGLLTALIPELNPAKGVDQPRVHVWDVFEHSIQTVSAVEFVLRESPLKYAGEEVLAVVPWSAELSRHLNREISHGSTGRSMLKLAALLHDIAKPQTKTMDDGRARFLGHQQEGAAIAAAVMERLRFSKREIKLTELLINHHLRPTQMSHEGLPTRRAIYRYFRDTGEAGIDLLFLCLADHLATRGHTLDLREWQAHAQMTAYVLEKRNEEANITEPPRLIDGNDIIKTFRLSPGPAIGELLEALREAQAAGEVTDPKQALDYVKNLLNNHKRTSRSRGDK